MNLGELNLTGNMDFNLKFSKWEPIWLYKLVVTNRA